MMKQKAIIPLMLLTATTAAGLLSGCAAKRTATQAVTTTPQGCVLTPDSAGRIDMDLTFHVPARYLSRRARLIS